MLFGLFKRKQVYRGGKPRFHERVAIFLLRVAAVAAVLAALGGIGWGVWSFQRFLFHSEYFAVRDVELASADLDSRVEGQVRARLQKLGVKGKNLLLLDTDAVRQALESIPKIRSAAVRKRYPSKLRIALRQRRMAALLFQDPILAIDDEGVVIETLTPRHPKALDFPFISGLPSERARLGDRIRNEALANALLLLSCLSAGAPDLLKKTSEVHCGENSHITLLLESGTEIRFGAGNPVRKMPLLETFLAKMGSPDQFAYVELRFEGQIPYKLR